jgi:hypothetical protein
MESLLMGTGIMIFLVVLWWAVQSGWKKTFAEQLTDEDVLAGRSRCGNCGCRDICREDGKEIL